MSAATAPASQARRPSPWAMLPLQLGPRGRPEITPEARPQIRNPSISGPKSINPLSNQMIIHQSLPQDVSRPIQRHLTEKSANPRTFGAPNFPARYLLVGPKQKTRRHVFSNQNMAGPSQKRRHASNFPTKTWPGQPKRDATLQILRPKHRQAKPNEGRSRDSSNVRFSGLTRGKAARQSDRKPEENQRIGQKTSQSRPDRPEMRRKPRGMEVGQTWLRYSRLARVPRGVRAPRSLNPSVP
jgi:hypothetical protein